MRSVFHRAFAPLKRTLPGAQSLRSIVTAITTPIQFSRQSGHFKSSMHRRPVSPAGQPIPWYTYPCIQFLQGRDYAEKTILEFGGGQSTLWWAARAKRVITIEQDEDWHGHLAKLIPGNVELNLIRNHGPSQDMDLDEVRGYLERIPGPVDIIVNDGTGNRQMLLPLSFAKLSDTGAMICDDSHGYGFHESTHDMDIMRVDFYGFQPGVIMHNCTSIFFRPDCFLFSPRHKIPDLAMDHYAQPLTQGAARPSPVCLFSPDT